MHSFSLSFAICNFLHLLAVGDRPKSLDQEEVTSIARQLATLEMKVISLLFAVIFAGVMAISYCPLEGQSTL